MYGVLCCIKSAEAALNPETGLIRRPIEAADVWRPALSRHIGATHLLAGLTSLSLF